MKRIDLFLKFFFKSFEENFECGIFYFYSRIFCYFGVFVFVHIELNFQKSCEAKNSNQHFVTFHFCV